MLRGALLRSRARALRGGARCEEGRRHHLSLTSSRFPSRLWPRRFGPCDYLKPLLRGGPNLSRWCLQAPGLPPVLSLSRMRNLERRSEVPWLANIPIVGFFFKEEGYNDEKSSLMIMLRARITDVKEELAQF